MKMKNSFKFHIGMRICKTAIAVFICAVFGLVFDLQPFYGMAAAIICMQNNTVKTLKKGAVRCIGTGVGGIFAVIILLLSDFTPLKPFTLIYYLLISLFIIPVIYVTVLTNQEDSAAISCIVFLSIVLAHIEDSNPYLFALLRMGETITGIIIAYAVNYIIKNPDRKNGKETEFDYENL